MELLVFQDHMPSHTAVQVAKEEPVSFERIEANVLRFLRHNECQMENSVVAPHGAALIC